MPPNPVYGAAIASSKVRAIVTQIVELEGIQGSDSLARFKKSKVGAGTGARHLNLLVPGNEDTYVYRRSLHPSPKPVVCIDFKPAQSAKQTTGQDIYHPEVEAREANDPDVYDRPIKSPDPAEPRDSLIDATPKGAPSEDVPDDDDDKWNPYACDANPADPRSSLIDATPTGAASEHVADDDDEHWNPYAADNETTEE
ncbi:hypothetical protein LTR37_005346 [Vermiconidia calcicola]|uniref:Uncharacterized protein n=1 Tax=Vermiconidia calcicola TaxID=1690605 RepID=A0ACC3NLH6_9PEZI|nr:hypothetical protein LTR37_005346 [Vermiconidia calcicola]